MGGTGILQGTGGSKGNSWPPVLALLLCPPLSRCSPRAETHKLLSFSLHPQGTKGPVGYPPSPLPGHPQIKRDSPALIRGLPVPISSRHLLLSWRPGSYPLPPSPCFLAPPSLPPLPSPPLPFEASLLFPLPFHPPPGPGTQTPTQGHKAPIDFCPNSTC